MNRLWIMIVFVLPASAAQISPEFARAPSRYARIAVAPIVCFHSRYASMLEVTQYGIAPASKDLNDRVCSNLTGEVSGILQSKAYRVVGAVRTLVAETELNTLDEQTRRTFDAVHLEFGRVSRVLHDEKARRGDFKFELGRNVKTLREKLGVKDADGLLLIDEHTWFVADVRGGRLYGCYLKGIQYNAGLVDAETGELLWWDTGTFREVAGQNDARLRDSLRTLFAKLPAIAR